MKKLLLIPLFIFITGFGSCETKPDPAVVIKTEYVVRQAPDSMYALPQQVTTLDLESASQREVAQWITESEDRTNTLERMIDALKIYFNQPVTPTETLPPIK